MKAHNQLGGTEVVKEEPRSEDDDGILEQDHSIFSGLL